MRPIQDEFRARFEAGQSNPSAKAAGLCRALLKLWPALWPSANEVGAAPRRRASGHSSPARWTPIRSSR
ncbi:MAG: hypothetical protein HY690_15415 [Chloroflexi bacterium]|nr:hypothetical protein [Chloroflexota bacterium]